MNATATVTVMAQKPISLREEADRILKKAKCRLDGRPLGTGVRSVGLVFTPMGGKVRRK
jgi:hypothetical protein